MSTSLDLWKAQLLAELPGATWEFVQLKLKSVIDSFYAKSGSWIAELPAINIKADKPTYKLNPQAHTVVMHVLQASWGGQTYYPRHREASGNTFSVPSNGVIELDTTPTEDVTRGLEVTAMLKPMPGCEEFPDDLGNVWYEVIRYGVLGEMQSMAQKPWTDKAESVVNRRRFMAGVAEARDVARKGYARIDAPVVFPPWAR
jgi:hypothetical protein